MRWMETYFHVVVVRKINWWVNNSIAHFDRSFSRQAKGKREKASHSSVMCEGGNAFQSNTSFKVNWVKRCQEKRWKISPPTATNYADWKRKGLSTIFPARKSFFLDLFSSLQRSFGSGKFETFFFCFLERTGQKVDILHWNILSDTDKESRWVKSDVKRKEQILQPERHKPLSLPFLCDVGTESVISK